jgi:hypothetical protein
MRPIPHRRQVPCQPPGTKFSHAGFVAEPLEQRSKTTQLAFPRDIEGHLLLLRDENFGSSTEDGEGSQER